MKTRKGSNFPFFYTMKKILFLLLLIGCGNRYISYQTLYQSEVEIIKLNKERDTVIVTYFDYIYQSNDSLLRKDNSLVVNKIKKYKILKTLKPTL